MLLWFQRNVDFFSLTNVSCMYLLDNTMIFFVSKCFRSWLSPGSVVLSSYLGKHYSILR